MCTLILITVLIYVHKKTPKKNNEKVLTKKQQKRNQYFDKLMCIILRHAFESKPIYVLVEDA